MVWWLLALVFAVLLLFTAPLVLGVVLFLGFAVIAAGNAYCVWLSIRRKVHHSTVPIVGATFGALGLWLLSDAIKHSAPAAWRVWYVAAPFVLDAGALILLVSIPVLAASAVRARFGRPKPVVPR